MNLAKEQIKRAYKDKVAKYGPIWAIIDEKWNNQLHCPIHAAGYFLNPQYHYKALAVGALSGEVRDGLIDCIDHMIPLECNQLEIHRAQWWEAFGSHCLQLQKFAIRILSQTCSATGCECNCSVFERIHTKKRNRLDQKRLNDLVYVQYNLWLKRNQSLNKRLDSNPNVLEDIDPTSDWAVESHPAELDSDEELDLDLQTVASLVHNIQLNADPLIPASRPAPSPPITGTSSAQPRRKRISRLSQWPLVAQPASATTSTVAVGDDEEEQP
eukprot:PITA_27632